jgi:ArsR family transcriptional regulator
MIVDRLLAMPASQTRNLERLAQVFHALSDETRLRVLELLRRGERCVCELTDTLDVAQSRLSFHLKTLKDAGLLRDRKDGRWVYYSLVPETLSELEDELAGLKSGRPTAQSTQSCCD